MRDIDFIKALWTGLIAVVTMLFGGMDKLFIALLIFMSLDYISGVLVAGIEKKLNSQKGFRGILKKTAFLMVVAVGHTVDITIGLEGTTRMLVISFLLANEGISILENCGNIGVPIPKKLLEMLEQLKEGKDV